MDQEQSYDTASASLPSRDRPEIERFESRGMSETNDYENDTLAELLENGDEVFFARMLDWVCPRVEAHLCRRYARVASYVEDLIWRALYALWRKRERYRREKGSVAQFYTRIAINLAKTQLRQGATQLEHQIVSLEFDEGDTYDPPGDDQDVGEYLEPNPIDPRHVVIEEILVGWPPNDRIIFCRYMTLPKNDRGNWAAELAEELQINQNTIRSKGPRLKQKMRKSLRKLGYEFADLPDESDEEKDVPPDQP